MLAALFTTLALLAGATAYPATTASCWSAPADVAASASDAAWPASASDAAWSASASDSAWSASASDAAASPSSAPWSGNSTWSTGTITPPPASFVVPLPDGQTNLTLPADQQLTIATVSRGVQNYTCTNGIWVSSGALANLYDVGALLEATAPVASGQKVTDGLSPLFLAAQPFPADSPTPSLKHEFVATPDAVAAISPRFFDPVTGSSVTLNKVGAINSPDNSTADISWLQLEAIGGQGDLASTVYRLQTAGGQLTGPCKIEGNVRSVDYAAMYYFLK
ncbi:hypothetical protein Q8F55_004126 [Vanrija albida]|uniref:Uncharacterized protein n=1 Tax=Vanrija albida TaxID=181172 RepID=A0ABR3Q5W5_9TREE